MGSKKRQIGLTLDERRKPDTHSFDYRSGATRRWIEQLPVGNIGETAKHLFQTLQEVNRIDIPWKDRQSFQEQLHEPVSYVQGSLARHYTTSAFPLPPKAQRIASLAQTLYLEMATGYKIAIEDMLGGSLLQRDNKALVLLIHRAIRYLSRAVIACYQIHAAHPRQSWLEMHQLYRYAEENSIHQEPVRDKLDSLLPRSTIANAYKQLLLLALANPYQLRRGETDTVYTALSDWAALAHLHPYDHPQADEMPVVIHMDNDEAPDYQALSHRDCDTRRCRLLDTRPLKHLLREEYQRANANANANETAAPLPRELLFRLLCAWGPPTRRHFSRTERQKTLEAVIGTTMLHQALALELGEASLLGKRATYASRTVRRSDLPTQDDVWNIFASDKIKNLYEAYSKTLDNNDEPKTQPGHAPDTHPRLSIQQWQILDESAGGYRLTLDHKAFGTVQVGELVGLRPPSQAHTWHIGVVRWLRQSNQPVLEIGVEVIAPQARPVMVRNVKAGGSASEFQYAMLLPEVAVTAQPASIITPVLLFQPGNEVQMQTPGEPVTLRLEAVIRDSGRFVQFRYSYSDSHQGERILT